MDEQEFRNLVEARAVVDQREWKIVNSPRNEENWQLSPEREEEIMERMFLLNTIKKLEEENKRLRNK